MARGQITTADILAVSDGIGVAQLLAKLGYDVSDPADQTASGLGVAERTQHLVRTVRRLVGQRAAPRLPPALEIYWFETSVLTADLRQSLVAAGGQVSLSHQLFSVDRRQPLLQWGLTQSSEEVRYGNHQQHRAALLQWGLTQSSEEVSCTFTVPVIVQSASMGPHPIE